MSILKTVLLGLLVAFIGLESGYAQTPGKKQGELVVLADSVRRKAENLLRGGFNAGISYHEVWIRDFNTFIQLACAVDDHRTIKESLKTFLKFQQADGSILDGYVALDNKSEPKSKYILTDSAPDLGGYKNSVETDQETSFIQAVCKYIDLTGDRGLLKEVVNGLHVESRLALALNYLYAHKYAKSYGLIYGATTVDWGDVQPETPWGVEMDASSHLAIDVYDNAMLLIAIKDYISLLKNTDPLKVFWMGKAKALKLNIRKHLWDVKSQKFIPHLYLNGSPFPATFDERQVYYHGGTTVAIEAGILTRDEVLNAYHQMKRDVELSGAATIGLTLYPVYPDGYFKNPQMKPFSYQNGGDWTWFGARMVTQLISYGYRKEALAALSPMLKRVVKNNGFYEWYSRDNMPSGSAGFKGEAGVLYTAIDALFKSR